MRSGRHHPPLCCLVLLALAALVFSADMARSQYCDLYFEEFPFGGPSDFDNGSFRVEWCINGASITSSNYCPTGNSLRLGSVNEDPIIWVFIGTQGCTQVRLEFDYGQFLDTLTQVYYSVGGDTTVNCSTSIPTSAGYLTETGGLCTAAQLTLPATGAQSVYFQFDHGANSNAIFIDNVRVFLETCDCEGGGDHDCCETGGPGCLDPVVMACVCAQDPYCCDTEWDEQCVSEVESLLCGDCGSGVLCATEYSTDFGTYFQSGTVCQLWPDLFETCEGDGPWITSGTDCGGTGDYAMVFASGYPYSAAVTPCLDLSATGPASLEFAYTKNASALGPRLEISLDGGSFNTLWEAPFSFPGGCQPVCVDLSGYAGEPEMRLKFSSGSSTANGAAFDDVLLVLGQGCPSCTDPMADAGPDLSLRNGETAQLQGNASGGSGGSCPGDYSPSWAGPGIVTGGNTFTPTVNATGEYTLTISCDTCQSADAMTVHPHTVSTALSCLPAIGTVPFTTQMAVVLTNTYAGLTRSLAGHLDADLAGGQHFSNWRSGHTNLAPGESYMASWNQSIPALGSVIGMNRFDLSVEDVTPAPYNQPPHPPAGDTDSDSCTVDAVVP